MQTTNLVHSVFDHITTTLDQLGFFINGAYTGILESSEYNKKTKQLQLNVISGNYINSYTYQSTLPFTNLVKLDDHKISGVTVNTARNKLLREISELYLTYNTNLDISWKIEYYRELSNYGFIESVITNNSIVIAFRASLDLSKIELTSIRLHDGSATDTDTFSNVNYSLTVFNTESITAIGNIDENNDLPDNLDTDPPSIPTDLISTDATVSTISIMWNNSIDNVEVTSYNVYRDSSLILSVPSISFVDDNNGTGLNEFTEYSYQITAVDDAGNESEKSQELSVMTLDLTAPTQPLSLQAGSITLTSLTLSWVASTDLNQIHHYLIYRDGANIGQSIIDEYDDTGLVVNSTYVYKVSAVDVSGNESVVSNELSITIEDKEDPSTPLNIVISNVTNSELDLFWDSALDNSGDIQSYAIYRNGINIANLAGTILTYHDSGLNEATEYTYTILAFDMADNMSAPTLVSATTLDQTPPRMPSNLHLTNIQFDKIEFAWNPVIDNYGIDKYKVYRNGTLLGTVVTPAYTDDNLTEYTQYSYTITAIDLSGNESLFSLPLVATTSDITSPSTALNLSANNITDVSLVLQWSNGADSGSGIDHYDIYRTGVKIGDSTLPSFNDSGLVEFTEYTYSVKSIDVSGNVSNFSPDLIVKTLDITPPTTITNLVASNITVNSATLTWVAPVNDTISYYAIIRNGEIVGSSTTLTFNDAGLVEFTNYNYTIVALDLSGNISPMSSSVNFKTLDETAPLKVTGLTASNLTATSFTLTWSNSIDNDVVSTYVIYKDAVLLTSTISTNSLDSAIATIDIGGLSEFQTYSFTVKAVDASGNESPISDPFLVTTLDVTVPSSPSNLVASNITHNTVDLEWDLSIDNDQIHHYNILRDNVIIMSSIDLVNLTFTDSLLTPETTYTYKLIAVDPSSNLSLASSNVSVLTIKAPTIVEIPVVPANLKNTVVWRNSVEVEWEQLDGGTEVASYQIFKDGILIGTVVLPNELIYYDDTVSKGETLSYTVASVDVDGVISDQSIPTIAIIPNTPLFYTESSVGDTFSPAIITTTSETITWTFEDGSTETGKAITHDFNMRKLTVGTGNGDGNFDIGSVAMIAADPPPNGKEFDAWVGDIADVVDINSPLTTTIIPAISSGITINSTYKTIVNPGPDFELIVIGGVGSGTYAAGDIIRIWPDDLDPALPDMTFFRWRVRTGSGIDDHLLEYATITMPSRRNVVVANYTIDPIKRAVDITPSSFLREPSTVYLNFQDCDLVGDVTDLVNGQTKLGASISVLRSEKATMEITDLPTDLYFYRFTNSGIAGNVKDLPTGNIPKATTQYRFTGCDNVYGNVRDLPDVSALLYFGSTNIVGTLVDLATKDSRYYSFSSTAITGDVGDLPDNKYYYSFSSCPGIFGNLADFPTNGKYYIFASNPNVVGDIKDLPSVTNQYYYYFPSTNITGLIADVPRNGIYYYFHNTLITGDIGDIPSTAKRAYFYPKGGQGVPKITVTGGVGHLTIIEILYFDSNNWTVTEVDSVIDSIYQNRNLYTYATPILYIAGTNANPSGVLQTSVTPTTGLEKTFILINDPHGEGFNKWRVVY